ncbi:hypothetical protein SAMN05421854_10430 [Amycolatopsis rubida]|uniref:Uncharacterized protein n=1 Tax=Amycolatopsis rubida TaxID=112413 RepID=A0A1I5MFI7_9PSEU|nr:hypothetical protein SAMN05421854_10430 [Amycolatopsis rubida]
MGGHLVHGERALPAQTQDLGSEIDSETRGRTL